jgi:ribosomal protein L37AE/L43A
MPPVDRNNPVRAKSSDSRVSFMEFQREYPDDAACLEFLWRTRYSEDGTNATCPKCEQVRPFKRYATAQRRQSWTCTACGYHAVSQKHLPTYLNEYVWRYNHRDDDEAQFRTLLMSAATPTPL